MSKIKSIDSKPRLNRWSFEVLAKGRSFAIPVVAFGPEERAHSISTYVHTDYSKLEAFKDVEFTVRPIRHEVISVETYNQINGLEVETKILGVALQDMAETFVCVGDPEKAIGDCITKARNIIATAYGMDKTSIVKEVNQAVANVEEVEDESSTGLEAIRAAFNGD